MPPAASVFRPRLLRRRRGSVRRRSPRAGPRRRRAPAPTAPPASAAAEKPAAATARLPAAPHACGCCALEGRGDAVGALPAALDEQAASSSMRSTAPRTDAASSAPARPNSAPASTMLCRSTLWTSSSAWCSDAASEDWSAREVSLLASPRRRTASEFLRGVGLLGVEGGERRFERARLRRRHRSSFRSMSERPTPSTVRVERGKGLALFRRRCEVLAGEADLAGRRPRPSR